MKTELNFNEFIKQQYSDWEKEAEISLKGKPISGLNTKTYEGFELKPLYTQEDLKTMKYLDFSYPGFEFFLRGTQLYGYKRGSWLNIADINDIEDTTLKKFLSKSNELCPDGISVNFNFPSHNQNIEKNISITENLKSYLINLDFEKTFFYFKLNFAPLQIFKIIDSLFGEMSVDKSEIKGGIEFDPVSFWIQSGKIQKNTEWVFKEMEELLKLIKVNYSKFSAIGIDLSVFHNSGANAVQELALTLAIGNLYILEMINRGFDINEIASKIRITMSVGTNFFGEIAKFRAIRVLWANLIKAYNGNYQKINLNVTTSFINKSKLDPYVNILRTTSETISAIIGGCNSLQTHSFEQIYKKADDFSFRLALNTQNVLREECNLLDVIDPAGGSYLVENLTLKYAEEAWKLFNELIEKGSLVDNLKSGYIQDLINNTSEARILNILIRKDILIGTNKYPNLTEENGINYKNQNESNNFNVSENSSDFYSISHKIYEETEFIDIKKLIQKRLAEPFEELRLRSENYYKSTGERPKVLLACFGNLKQYKPRADFSSEYFAVGGFESHLLTFDNIDTAVLEISKSKIKVCVLCSSDEMYESLVEEFAKQMKNKINDIILILAGNPGDNESRYSSSGVDDYIYLRSSIVEKLSLIMNKLGI